MYAKILLMAAVLLTGQVYAQSTTTSTTASSTKEKKKKEAPKATSSATQPSAAPVVEEKKDEKKEEPKDAQAAAVTPNQGMPQQILTYIKEKFSFSYHGEYYGVRRDALSQNESDRKIQDFKMLHNPTVVYKPTANWQILTTAEFKYSDQPHTVATAAYPNDFYRALVTLTRKNVLTEKDDFVKVDIGIGRRIFNTGAEQQRGGKYALSSYGNSRLFTTISKTFDKHSASLFLQLMNNDYKWMAPTTWKNSLEVIPTINLQLTEKLSYLFNDDIVFNTPLYNDTARKVSTSHDMNLAYLNYQWNDKINTYYQFKYYHGDDFTRNPQTQDDWFEHYLGIGYAFPKASVAFELGSELFHARDGRFFSEKTKYPELAVYLDFSL